MIKLIQTNKKGPCLILSLTTKRGKVPKILSPKPFKLLFIQHFNQSFSITVGFLYFSLTTSQKRKTKIKYSSKFCSIPFFVFSEFTRKPLIHILVDQVYIIFFIYDAYNI